jgi:hypothetical protein
MASVEPKDLIAAISAKEIQHYRREEQEKFRSSISESEIRDYLSKIGFDFEKFEDSLLKRGVISGIIGALYAFIDRSLSPLDQNHIHIYNLIAKEIEEVYFEIKDKIPDEDTWLFETFDYGIKHVYYLDWKLYLSAICY